ncbi:MAG: EamA family transporter RarD [Rhodobacteraceae bacterium CG17_big_fil_post_rev_8_21_14_2_50_65_11]|nr:MAG: EamA family transporter RarD [Rhodobacteraceae bacterium CG17_big_fil_post_rev_8_21_14_2_50_65_11]
MSEAHKGVAALVAACVVWGLSPLYYKLLAHLPPLEVLAHRTLWSFAAFGIVLLVQGRLALIAAAFSMRRQIVIAFFSALAISVNWFLFIYAVGAGRALEASIGYYIYPLVAVVAGFVVMREAIAPLQWVAVGLVALAVLVLTAGLGVAPWISLALAFSFAGYGVLKRWIASGPVVSVTVETLLLTPLALVVLGVWGQGAFAANWRDAGLLALSGPLTAVPLILFSYATKRAAMATVGLTLYLNPTLQFLVAWLVFREAVTGWHAIALPMIWAALALYSGVAVRRAARGSATP